jgi:hypothetical protein
MFISANLAATKCRARLYRSWVPELPLWAEAAPNLGRDFRTNVCRPRENWRIFSPRNRCSVGEEQYDRSDLAKVSSYYAEIMGRTRLRQLLREVLSRDLQPGPLHRLLAGLGRKP